MKQGQTNWHVSTSRVLPSADSVRDPRRQHREYRWSVGRAVCLLLCSLCALGCRGANHFMAESLPSSLRLASQANPQEVDLSRLASATGGSEMIGPGDVLEVSIAAGLSANDKVEIPVRVGNDGTGSLPDIGNVQLAGFEPEAAESLIRLEAIKRGLYHNPTVTVTIKHARMNRIRVLGAVKEQGTVQLPPNASDVVSAIAAAGGLADNAGTRVEIRNPARRREDVPPAVADNGSGPFSPVSSTSGASSTGMNSYSIDLISAAKEGDGSYMVEDGGVIMVEKRDPLPVTVTGLVRKADQYPFPVGKDLTVLQAIAMAGGTSNQLADKVYVIRPLTNSGDPAVIQLSIRTAKKSGDSNIKLGPGDVVSVEQTPATVVMEMLQIIRFGVNSSVGLF
jgi:polysaccharide export outer membrane protein